MQLAAVRLRLCFPADRAFLLSNAEIHFLCSPEKNCSRWEVVPTLFSQYLWDF
jgi:hypothetical protein